MTLILKNVKKASKKKLFTVISTFAGVGGSSTGYRLAGGHILAINEFVPKAQEAYHKNYPETPIFPGDIRKLKAKKILKKLNLKVGELDIFDGSPPCSGFSMAGIREKGWGKVKKYSDTAQRVDDLFFEYARLVKELQPRVFIAENVKAITAGSAKYKLGTKVTPLFSTLDSDGNESIIQTLIKCGYNVEYKVLNSMYYGVPQKRERTIIIGVRKDLNKIPTFPKKQFPIVTIKNSFIDISNEESDINEVIDFTKNHSIHKYLKLCKPGEQVSVHHPKGTYFTSVKVNLKEPSPTILASIASGLYHPDDRLLTIPELKRIQSLPDDYYLGDKLKDKWERIGRSVPPLMMKAIAEHVYETILKPYSNEN